MTFPRGMTCSRWVTCSRSKWISRSTRRALSVLGVVIGCAARADAQAVAIPVVPELRVDAMMGNQPSVQVAAGANFPMGQYVRIGVLAGVGARTDDITPRAAGRLDLVGRFLLDPFRQTRWGLSAGGGVSLRAEPGDRMRPNLLVVMDLEGPRSVYGASPAIQIGLGGGLRVGAALRWSRRAAR